MRRTMRDEDTCPAMTGARSIRPRVALKPGGCFARQSHIRLRRMS